MGLIMAKYRQRAAGGDLNICLLSREYPPDTAWGGIGTYTYNLAKGLTKTGQNVHIITQSLDIDREYIDNDIHVHRISHKSLFPFKGKFREFGLRWEYSQNIYIKLREIIEKYNVDIVEAPNLSGESFIYSFHKKTPLVIRLHTHFTEVIHFLDWKWNLDRNFSCWFENVAILRSDLIVCSTEVHAKLVAKEIGIDNNRIKIIPLGISLPELTEEKRENFNRKVLFVGRLEKRKGIQVLIQAIPYVLKKNSNVIFLVIGRDTFASSREIGFSGPKELSYKEQLINMLPNEYREKVQFLGYVSQKELEQYYRMCDIFVAPSLYESFGYIYIEAMSYAKPVIGCGVGGVPEVIKDGETGILVPPQDHLSLAEAIINLLKDSALRRNIGINARKYVEKNFTNEPMVERTLAAYRELLKNV